MRLLPFDYSVRNLGRSPKRLVLIISAGALVVSLVLAAAAFVRGMERSLTVGGNASNVILLATGSEESVERSQIPSSVPGVVAAGLSGIKTQFTVPFVSPEVHVAIFVRADRQSGEEWRAMLRGVTPAAFLVYPRVHIVEGRVPEPGKDEVMVGAMAADMMRVPQERVSVGKSLWFSNRAWRIVGRFQAQGAVMDGEIWVPVTDLQVATRRDTFSCVVLTLGDGDFADVDAFTKQRLDLGLTVIQELDYYSSIMRFYRPAHTLIWTTALLVALAGLLGGLNTMYAAFAARAREFGTLQAVGYSRVAILVSLLQESLLTAAAGTLIGSVVGIVFINGHAVRFSMGVFQLIVDDRVLLVGVLAGFAIGTIGVAPPAWRCLRLPITEALKAA
ncbi:MAG: ABC transporter permease [Deltaproteobacteria bacterium]|nr:ABC transporter permease [Deltaproteobacteria bacterium]